MRKIYSLFEYERPVSYTGQSPRRQMKLGKFQDPSGEAGFSHVTARGFLRPEEATISDSD